MSLSHVSYADGFVLRDIHIVVWSVLNSMVVVVDTMVPLAVDTTVYRGTSKDIYMISRERHCVYGWMDRCYTWFVAVGQDASGEISQQKLRMSKISFWYVKANFTRVLHRNCTSE